MSVDNELTQYYEKLKAAHNYAQEQLTQNAWNAEQVEQYMQYYFGNDWQESLHALEVKSHEHPHKHAGALLLLAALLFVSITASLISPMLTLAGNVVVEQPVDIVLFGGDVERISEKHSITNISLDAIYTGPDDLQLLIEDRNGLHPLAYVYPDRVECFGCNSQYEAPLLLHAQEGQGSVRISNIKFTRLTT